MFRLPTLQGECSPKNEQDVIYFSCDYDYFIKHGYALAKSIFGTVGWIHVHVHINLMKAILIIKY